MIASDGVNPYVDVPARVSRAFAAFAERGRIRVAGKIDGHPFHATLLPTRAGPHRLYVNGGMRAGSASDVGATVTLELRPLRADEVEVPEDLAAALARAGLRRRFDGLSSSHRRELLRSIEDARSATNRAARIERTLAHLRGESTQQPRPSVVDRPLWICPDCGHSFVTKNMNHSCAHYELSDVFGKRPAYVRALFERFRAMIDERGPTTMVVYRDRVAFMVKVRFAGTMPKRDHLELNFWFVERDDDPRWSKIETIATNIHVHRTKIHALDDLDERVRGWIDRSRVGSREHLAGRQ